MAIPYENLKPQNVKDATWTAVVTAWENGLSDREASFLASQSGDYIKATDIAQWIKDNPEIGELKANLHSTLLSAAKLTVADALRDKDLKTAKWYLERKAPDEFSTKQAVAFEGAVIELSLEEKEAKLNELFDDLDGE